MRQSPLSDATPKALTTSDASEPIIIIDNGPHRLLSTYPGSAEPFTVVDAVYEADRLMPPLTSK